MLHTWVLSELSSLNPDGFLFYQFELPTCQANLQQQLNQHEGGIFCSNLISETYG